MKQFIYLTGCLLFVLACASQTSESNDKAATNVNGDGATNRDSAINLVIIDTVEIADPMMILFKETLSDNRNSQTVLISKRSLDVIQQKDTMNYRDFISSQGYLFFDAGSSSCLINNLLYDFPHLKTDPFYKKLQTDITADIKDTVWVTSNKGKGHPKKYKSWEYYEIYKRKFLLCLVKGKALSRCQSFDEIVLTDMYNVYFPVLIPFPD